MAAYADDFIAWGSIRILKHCWDGLCNFGSKFGYYQEKTKYWFIIKEDFKEKVRVSCLNNIRRSEAPRNSSWKNII